MPHDVRQALDTNRLMEAYRERPAYQRNDYLGWIEKVKRAQTREKRIGQMLDELERGGIYMNMAHRPSAKSRP